MNTARLIFAQAIANDWPNVNATAAADAALAALQKFWTSDEEVKRVHRRAVTGAPLFRSEIRDIINALFEESS